VRRWHFARGSTVRHDPDLPAHRSSQPPPRQRNA
jgi:hypothetical protein